MNIAAQTTSPSFTAALQRHIDSHRTAGSDPQHWPVDAVYYVEYRLKAWPCGFEPYTQFFSSAEELTRWYDEISNWAKCEDNYFEFDSLYMWDLGPELIEDRTPHLNAR